MKITILPDGGRKMGPEGNWTERRVWEKSLSPLNVDVWPLATQFLWVFPCAASFQPLRGVITHHTSLQLGRNPHDGGYHVFVLFTAVSSVPGTVFKVYLLKEWMNAQFYIVVTHAKIKKTESWTWDGEKKFHMDFFSVKFQVFISRKKSSNISFKWSR